MRHVGSMLCLAMLAASAEAADTVCRPNNLGAVVCTGPTARPAPRQIIRSDVQALERVPSRKEAGEPATEFVPAYRRGSLSSTTIETDRPVDLCRPDTLGNLRCR
jgi:hypothetical protein